MYRLLFIPIMEAIRSSEELVLTGGTRRNIPETAFFTRELDGLEILY
jgi:hypothetical protein